jgi:hypothetical protein
VPAMHLTRFELQVSRRAGRGGAGQKPKADLRLLGRFEIRHWQIWFGPETRSEWQKWRPHPVCEARAGSDSEVKK